MAIYLSMIIDLILISRYLVGIGVNDCRDISIHSREMVEKNIKDLFIKFLKHKYPKGKLRNNKRTISFDFNDDTLNKFFELLKDGSNRTRYASYGNIKSQISKNKLKTISYTMENIFSYSSYNYYRFSLKKKKISLKISYPDYSYLQSYSYGYCARIEAIYRIFTELDDLIKKEYQNLQDIVSSLDEDERTLALSRASQIEGDS